jgi:hypothetical protein
MSALFVARGVPCGGRRVCGLLAVRHATHRVGPWDVTPRLICPGGSPGVLQGMPGGGPLVGHGHGRLLALPFPSAFLSVSQKTTSPSWMRGYPSWRPGDHPHHTSILRKREDRMNWEAAGQGELGWQRRRPIHPLTHGRGLHPSVNRHGRKESISLDRLAE